MTPADTTADLRRNRHSRLFELYRQEAPLPDEISSPPCISIDTQEADLRAAAVESLLRPLDSKRTFWKRWLR